MAENAHSETRLRGLPLSEGVAVARVCMFDEERHNKLPMYRIEDDGIDGEIARIKHAVDIAHRNLEDIRRKVEAQIGPAEAGIFTAQIMILEDETLGKEIEQVLTNRKINAEMAVTEVLDRYEGRLLAVDNEYIKERASDFGEIKRRLLDQLQSLKPSLQCHEDHCQRGRNRIIVAEELTPQITVDLETGHTMGFVAERGGRNSHAAILARALGIPAVSGLANIRDRVHCGMEILVNGNNGEVVLRPRERTVTALRVSSPYGIRMPEPANPVSGFAVMANISVSSEAEEATRMKAEGIGLYRTEIEIIARGRACTEDDLHDAYATAARGMPDHGVTYRLFDLGSDKTLPALTLSSEQNPALGLRGSRLLLAHRELLRIQVRALARLSRTRPIAILYPMVIDKKQFVEMTQLFDTFTRDIRPGPIAHGAMFEVPSACIKAEAILETADFGSIGTNDLMQYLFAVDRDNVLVAGDYDTEHPILWDMIAGMAEAAKKRGKPLTICGEVAGNPNHVERILDAGIRRVSVSTRRITAVRTMARTILGGKQTAKPVEGAAPS